MKHIGDIKNKMLFYYERMKQVEKALNTGCNKASIKIEHPDIRLNIRDESVNIEIAVACRQILEEKQREFKTMYDQFAQEYCELLLAQDDTDEN